MREAFFLIDAMNVRKSRQWNLDHDMVEIQRGFDASIHGAQYTPQLRSNADTKDVADFTEEQEDVIKKHLERRLESMKQRGES